ncbi:hypothetical protein OG762_48090 (plasmid) [Streptomyces sp. NBC_01136]|uniref:hypothetical protein n=1 Tax=unclassified Streptomyces TaxID=2593676 RepID=UPI002F90BC1C|nr:hypothetical protein OG762_48090 [Streptomyces sp. NBC_01136]
MTGQPGASVLVDAAAAMQRAWYVDGRGLSDVQVYRDIAAELGLDSVQPRRPPTRRTGRSQGQYT